MDRIHIPEGPVFVMNDAKQFIVKTTKTKNKKSKNTKFSYDFAGLL